MVALWCSDYHDCFNNKTTIIPKPKPCHTALQIRADPTSLPKLSALVIKLRSMMTPPLASLAALGTHDAEAATTEVVSYFSRGLLGITQSNLKVTP